MGENQEPLMYFHSVGQTAWAFFCPGRWVLLRCWLSRSPAAVWQCGTWFGALQQWVKWQGGGSRFMFSLKPTGIFGYNMLITILEAMVWPTRLSHCSVFHVGTRAVTMHFIISTCRVGQVLPTVAAHCPAARGFVGRSWGFSRRNVEIILRMKFGGK